MQSGVMLINDLSNATDRLIKLMLRFAILLAVPVLAIPSLIVTFYPHQDTTAKNVSAPIYWMDAEISSFHSTTGKIATATKAKEISLGWLSGSNTQVAGYKHLDIISPLFATINASYGTQQVLAPEMITRLHREGKKVWGRVAMQQQSSGEISRFLTDRNKMGQVIQEIRLDAERSHLDGINLDIENVAVKDRSAFTVLINDFSKTLKLDQITLSIDLQPEMFGGQNSYLSFNKLIGMYCDYIVLMGYDEHWSTDPYPGPVTSLQWLRKNIEQLIQTDIPAQKLVLGLPSYTRIWQVGVDGKSLGSQALSSAYASNLLKTHHPEEWQPANATYYFSYSEQNKNYEAWLTDDRSIKAFLNLSNQYHLAGFGFWNLDMMPSNEWNTLSRTVYSN